MRRVMRRTWRVITYGPIQATSFVGHDPVAALILTLILAGAGGAFATFFVTDDSILTTAVVTGVLALITGLYAWHTRKMTIAAQLQAEASLRIAEESKLARQDSVRPLLVLGALRGNTLRERILNPPPVAHFSSEENRDIVVRWRGDVFNVGAGPSVQASVLLVIGDSPREREGTRHGPNRDDLPPLGSHHAYERSLAVRTGLPLPEDGELIVVVY